MKIANRGYESARNGLASVVCYRSFSPRVHPGKCRAIHFFWFCNMAKTVVVTAANSDYFHLLKDWFASMAAFPELGNLDCCVLDVGLNGEQREWLKAQGIRTIEPAWDFDVKLRPDLPHYYKAMTVRPFLPRYFPEYAIIIWLDADIWIQNPSYLRDYVLGAERYGFVLTPEVDRAYSTMFGEYNKTRLFHHSVYYKNFGRAVADQLINYPILNAGAFAAQRDHPILEHLAEDISASYSELQYAEFGSGGVELGNLQRSAR